MFSLLKKPDGRKEASTVASASAGDSRAFSKLVDLNKVQLGDGGGEGRERSARVVINLMVKNMPGGKQTIVLL